MMTPKQKREIEIGDIAVRCCKTALANILATEAKRFGAKATELKAKAFDAGGGNDLDKRLIRDHEIRCQTFKEAAHIIAA